MKPFKEMSHEEKITWAVGSLTLAIGEGKFRDAVAALVNAVSEDAFERGAEYAVQLKVRQ